ncbi:MAG: tRNA (adenosine(37)-N6)-dimethylallyltransferase MiaA [Aggregatilineales bacterium]
MTGSPLIIILGPTAVGKTATAIELAQRLQTDILSADSRQIYRYMNIGTAKPTLEQQAAIPHHLIDLVDPDDTLSLAQYLRAAREAIQQQHEAGRVALLVGGTGQYITALEAGWSVPEVPPNEALRAELEAFARDAGVHALHARLAALDPAYAARTHPNNVRRVVRALEVCLTTGSTMTLLQQQQPVPYRILRIGLTLPRDALYARADQRVLQMIEVGLVDEVQGLLARGYDPSLPSLSSIGYQEIIAHLNGQLTLDEAIARIQFSTHDFIRRQEVWFRGHDYGILWHNMLETSNQTIIATVTQWLWSSS